MADSWQLVDDCDASSSSKGGEPPCSAGRTAVTVDLLRSVFPDKPEEKLAAWVSALRAEEIEAVEDARELLADAHKEEWNQLPLPVVVRTALRAMFREILARGACAVQWGGNQGSEPGVVSEQPEAGPLVPGPVDAASDPAEEVAVVQQLDCIVLDVSFSMKSMSVLDPLKTREDVSKLMFHTMVDKILCLEMNHAVALVSFGKDIDVVKRPTMEYEAFHDEMGRLDARSSGTRLYDAVATAADLLLAFRASNQLRLVDGCPLRIFALTDGEDNASSLRADEVARKLQDSNITLDALPLGPPNGTLQAMSRATGGFCVAVKDEEAGIGLFESEKMLHVASREAAERTQAARIGSPADLEGLVDVRTVVSRLTSAVPQHVRSSRTVTASQALESFAGAGAGAGDAPRRPSQKRVLREFHEITASVQAFPPGDIAYSAHIVEGDLSSWKVIVRSAPASAYAGAYFAASMTFPNDYPFKPPRFRFITPVYHCNVNNDGAVCLDILKEHWSPALTAEKVLFSIRELLDSPNPDDPLDSWKASLFKSDPEKYKSEAARAAQQHAHATYADACQANNIQL